MKIDYRWNINNKYLNCVIVFSFLCKSLSSHNLFMKKKASSPFAFICKSMNLNENKNRFNWIWSIFKVWNEYIYSGIYSEEIESDKLIDFLSILLEITTIDCVDAITFSSTSSSFGLLRINSHVMPIWQTSQFYIEFCTSFFLLIDNGLYWTCNFNAIDLIVTKMSLCMSFGCCKWSVLR